MFIWGGHFSYFMDIKMTNLNNIHWCRANCSTLTPSSAKVCVWMNVIIFLESRKVQYSNGGIMSLLDAFDMGDHHHKIIRFWIGRRKYHALFHDYSVLRYTYFCNLLSSYVNDRHTQNFVEYNLSACSSLCIN